MSSDIYGNLGMHLHTDTKARSEGYKILMIAPTSFFADYGCHVRILEEALVLKELGNQITICTYHSGRDLDGLDLRRSLSIPWRQGYEVGSSRHKIAFDLLLSLTSVKAMMELRPDVIHAHLHEGAFIGHFLRAFRSVPLVFDFQGSLTGEMVDHHFLDPNGWAYQPVLRLEQAIDRFPDAIITSSRHAENLLLSEFHCPKEKVETVQDCVNTQFFSPVQDVDLVNKLKQRWGIPPDGIVVVYLGLLAEYQGTRHLLEAAKLACQERNDLYFVIMGFPAVSKYRTLASELGILDRVTFTGRVPYEAAPLHLSAGDIAVAPKLSATEGSGKILNYMAMRLPTVSFDTPVSREYLAEKGVFARPGDSEDLAQGILLLAGDVALRDRLGKLLRDRVIEHYTWEKAADKILSVYRRICHS